MEPLPSCSGPIPSACNEPVHYRHRGSNHVVLFSFSQIFVIRQQAAAVLPAMTGSLTVFVQPLNGTLDGSGTYTLDVTAGTQALVLAISLLTYGTTSFGVESLGAIVDTTSSGTDDTQTAYVLSGLRTWLSGALLLPATAIPGPWVLPRTPTLRSGSSFRMEPHRRLLLRPTRTSL